MTPSMAILLTTLLILGQLTTRGLYLVDLLGDFANPKNTQKKWQNFFFNFFTVSKKCHFVSNFFYFFLLFFNFCCYYTFLQTHLSPKIGDKWKVKYNI